MLLPVETATFRLRAYRPSDAAALAEQRSDPTTAEWQDFALPYPLEKAQEIVDSPFDGPTPGEWWGLAIADPATDEYMGSLAIHLAGHSHTAEVGYSLSPAHRGKGIATAATRLLVDSLFERPDIIRVEASLHPDNIASAMVLERLGFVYEGTSKNAFWVGDVMSDDPHYAVFRDQWQAWHSRPTAPPTDVQLTEISRPKLSAVMKLTTHRSQERFVSPVTRSLSEALIPPIEGGVVVTPWYRAVEADGDIVGFVMLAEPDATILHPYLWRLLIDRAHQRRSIGRRVLDLIVADRRAEGDKHMLVSYMPGLGSPEPLYRTYGFVPTGKVDEDGDIEALLKL